MRKTILSAFFILATAFSAGAQFYTNGDDPSYLRWYSVETPYYKIIYPEGTDSLARVYGTLLEQFRAPMGHTIGRTPGEIPSGKKMPVVLHTHNAYSNGSVAWAPRRMDLYTLPEAYGSDPSPWEVQLASHEPRHQAQLQYAYEGWMKYVGWLVGDIASPVAWAVYLDSPFGEGDAVVAETGLASGTRARTADFLEYFRVAYGEGDFRTWNRWRYGSFKYYTPDVYKIGYMTVAGARVFKDNPFAIRDMLDGSRKHPWDMSPYNLGVGGKHYKALSEGFAGIWKEEEAARAPFMPSERISAKEAFPVEYSTPVELDGTIYMIRGGYTRNNQLVAFRDGVFTTLRPMATHASSLFPDPVYGRIYWTETIGHPRWELDGVSVVRYYDTARNKVVDLTSEGRLYNPNPSADGTRLAVVEYPHEGGAAVLVLSADNGAVLERHPAPSGVQITEQTWLGDDIYAIGLEEGGYDLFRLQGSSWTRLFGPVPCKMVNLGTWDDSSIEWVADNTGVNELYRYFPAEGRLVQVTNTRYGATDFCRLDKDIYYISRTLDGRALTKTAVEDLPMKTVPVGSAHAYKIEDLLTAQENALGGVDRSAPVTFTEPVRFRKLANPLTFHSWAPVWVNYDAVMNDSFDFTYDNASPGMTLFFQNLLGTFSGAVGYGIHPDPDVDGHWRNAFHAIFTYTGQYPVIEASFDIGDQAASQYCLYSLSIPGSTTKQTSVQLRNAPFAAGTLRAYVPLRFNKGGWLRGITPTVSYSVSNNLFSTSERLFCTDPGIFAGLSTHYRFVGFSEGSNKLLQSASASIRGYIMQPTAHSRVYPKLGVGAEIGTRARLGLASVFAPNVYAYMYGYLPGLYQTHGLRLSALAQKQVRSDDTIFGELAASTVPRGFDSIDPAVAASNPVQVKFTADYAMPFAFGDLSLMPVMYIRNFILTPHADYTALSSGNLWSVGADLNMVLNYLVIALDLNAGISVSYLGGSWFESSGQKDRWYVGPVLSMDF